MKKTTTHSPEVRERAVRMVLEHLNDYTSEWAAIEAIAPKIGCVAQTLHGWIRRHQTDAGKRTCIPGVPRMNNLLRDHR